MNNSGGWKPQKGWLVDKEVPRNKAGDPAFKDLGVVLKEDTTGIEESETFLHDGEMSVLGVFTPEQVTYIVNKWLYSQDYQRTVHRNRAQEEREMLAPVKERFKVMFGGSFAKATEDQIRKVVESLKREKEEQK